MDRVAQVGHADNLFACQRRVGTLQCFGDEGMGEGLFESAPRSAGDRAGVFEADGETGYFYLFDTSGEKADRIVGAIWVFDGPPDFGESDLLIKWNSTEEVVGLFIRTTLVAAFEADTGAKHPEEFDATTDFET